MACGFGALVGHEAVALAGDDEFGVFDERHAVLGGEALCAGADEVDVRGLLKDEAGGLDGVAEVLDAGDAAGAEVGTVHKQGVELDATVAGEEGAAAGVEGVVVFHDGDGGLYGVDGGATAGESRPAGVEGSGDATLVGCDSVVGHGPGTAVDEEDGLHVGELPSASRLARRKLDVAALGFGVGVADAMDDRDGGEDGEDPKGGRHGSPALEEGTEDDEYDALGALHEAYFAGADEGFGAGAGVADHKAGGHDEGYEEDVEEAIAAGVEDEQAEKESDVGVAVEDGVEEGSEDGDLIGLAGYAAVDHVEEAGTDDDEAGVEEHADVVVGAGVAEEEGGDDVDEETDEGEGVGRDFGESEAVNNLL